MSHPTISPPDAQRPLLVGVDVGGTTIKFGVVDDQGRTLSQTSIPTEDEKGADDAIGRIGDTVERLLADLGLKLDDVCAVGLGTPGTLDIPKGMILKPHNLPGWRDYPIRDRLAQRLGKPVTYANDASAAAYGTEVDGLASREAEDVARHAVNRDGSDRRWSSRLGNRDAAEGRREHDRDRCE